MLAAAGRCFGASGFEATTLDRIAAEAGVTKPIVYRHFTSKEALYLALLAKHREDLSGFFGGIDFPGESIEDSLRLVLDRWFDYVGRNSHAWLMLFRDSTGGEEIRAFRVEVSARAREVMAELLRSARGAVPAEQIEPTAELLRSGLAGLALWSIDDPEADRSTLVEVALRVASPAF